MPLSGARLDHHGLLHGSLRPQEGALPPADRALVEASPVCAMAEETAAAHRGQCAAAVSSEHFLVRFRVIR